MNLANNPCEHLSSNGKDPLNSRSILDSVFSECQQEVDTAIQARVDCPDGTFCLTFSDKRFLLRAARVALEAKLRRVTITEADFSGVPEAILKNTGQVYVTFYNKDQILGCQSAREANLLRAVLKAVPKSIADTRFPEQASRVNVSNIRIEIDILLNNREVQISQETQLPSGINLGLDAVRLELDGKRAQFKAGVPMSRGWTLGTTMRLLSRKAGLDQNAYRDPNAKVWASRSFEFGEAFEDRFLPPHLTDRLRGRPVVFQRQIDRQRLEQSLGLAARYLRRNITPKGRMTYEYYLKTHERSYSSASVAVLRILATVWSTIVLGRFVSNRSLVATSKTVIDNLAGRFLADDLYVLTIGQAWLGHQAFLLAALLSLGDSSYRPGMIDRLVTLIMDLENRDGGYLSVQILPTRDDGTSPKQIYYSGEGLTALAMAATAKGDNSILATHKRVLPFYERMFDEVDVWMNMCAWHSKAYAEAFRLNGDEDFARFVLKMNDRLVLNQRTKLEDNVDYAGAFGRKGNSYSTGVFMESLAEGFSVAKSTNDTERMNTYGKALYMGMRYLVSCQIDRRRVFDLELGGRAIGGFETNVGEPVVRIDNLQHCCMAIIRFLEEVNPRYCPAE